MKHDHDPVQTTEIQRLRHDLETHRVFKAIVDQASLRRFMQVHVFAVWDFMSLAKRLQRDMTCVELPWMPPANATAARLINEIVLGEESDVDPEGEAASHLELYLSAMKEVDAPTTIFDDFMARMRRGTPAPEALEACGAPRFVRDFVNNTLTTALGGDTLQVLASFFYGRENVIPGMFRGLLSRWGVAREQAPRFTYYLDRHIELDGDSHGPAAARLIAAELERHPERLQYARQAALESLQARRRLWDGTLQLLREREAPAVHAAEALALP